jgi:hypothetical protein
MKKTVWLKALAAMALLHIDAFGQISDPSITMNSVISDGFIKGTVTGFSPKETGNYCVVVYVHTDLWYIHPYASGGLGKSWTEIDSGMRWQIPTVRREFPADRAAALLRRNDNGECPAPAGVHSIEGVASGKSFTIRELANTGDFGKL